VKQVNEEGLSILPKARGRIQDAVLKRDFVMVVVPAVRVTVDVKDTVVVGSGSDSDALLLFVSVVL
jgi:hypothetical protein